MPPAIDVPARAGFTVEVTGEAATITLCRPDRRNSQTPDTWLALARVGSVLPATVRVVVVRGTGPSFSAGLDRALWPMAADGGAPGKRAAGAAPAGDGAAVGGNGLAELAALPAERFDETIASFQAGFGWLSRPDLVSIAVVQGHAIGAGFQLALACDLRLLAEDARLAMVEPALGLVPDLGGTKRLVGLVGYSRAAQLCLTGQAIDAAQAQQMGLASAVVPADELAAATERTVAAVLALPRDAVIETKALLAAAAGRSQAEQEAAERAAQHRRLRELVGIVDER